MDATKSLERVISEITSSLKKLLSGVTSIPPPFTLYTKEYTLHKNDRSLVHRLLDAENPANKIAAHIVINTILRKKFLLE